MSVYGFGFAFSATPRMIRHSARVLTLSAVLLVVLLVAFVLALAGSQGQGRQDIQSRFAERARLSAALTEAVFESSAAAGAAVDRKKFGGAVVLSRALTAFGRVNQSDGVVLLDSLGRVLGSASTTPRALVVAVRARPAYLGRVLGGSPYALSDVLHVAGTAPTIAFVQGFSTQKGDQRRLLVSFFRPRVLYGFFGSYLSRVPISGGNAYMLDARGEVIGASAGVRRGASGSLASELVLARGIAGRAQGTLGATYFATESVRRTPWRVVLTAPAAAIFAPVSGLRKWLPWLILGAFLGTAGVAFWLLRRASRSAIDLLQAQERYALVVRGANDGIWDYDLLTGEVYLSPRWKSMLGLPTETESSVELWTSLVQDDDRPALESHFQAHQDEEDSFFEHEYRMRHADGTYRWVRVRGVAVRGPSGTMARIAGSMGDITARKLAEARLRQDALHDGLTGLANRKLFMDRLQVSLARCTRDSSMRCAVLFLDLDRFKVINDSFSHVTGDELLIEVGRRLDSLLRPGDTLSREGSEDTVARLGGDEYTILLDEIERPEQAELVAKRIHAALREPFQIHNRHIVIAGSIGIALSEPGSTVGDMMRNADLAMYEAKRQGPGRVSLFTDSLHVQVTRHLQLETALRSAIDGGCMRVFYQPIVDLTSGRLNGFEALARWPEDLPPIGPDEFIPVAEETGLIGALGRLVLTTACTDLGRWRAEGLVAEDVTMNVNIAGKQFNEPDDLIADVRAALNLGDIPAEALRLEITEGTLITDPRRLRETLQALSDLGVRAHIDDFGTGYSSMTVLQHFSGDALKIDRSFISSMHHEEGHLEIVRATVSLAHNLGLRTIAEGIDHPAQLQRLRHLGCEDGQGFLFSQAVAPTKVTDLVASWDVDIIEKHFPAAGNSLLTWP
jgi:diguanylate cyclase (GGDEF)-like protein/PAS domain S-box-containing protein